METAYQQQALRSANAIELIIALYDGAIRFLYRAIQCVEENDEIGRRAAVKRAVDIIMYLQARLRTDIGGKPAAALSDFYTAMFTMTLEASHIASRQAVQRGHRLPAQRPRSLAGRRPRSRSPEASSPRTALPVRALLHSRIRAHPYPRAPARRRLAHPLVRLAPPNHAPAPARLLPRVVLPHRRKDVQHFAVLQRRGLMLHAARHQEAIARPHLKHSPRMLEPDPPADDDTPSVRADGCAARPPNLSTIVCRTSIIAGLYDITCRRSPGSGVDISFLVRWNHFNGMP